MGATAEHQNATAVQVSHITGRWTHGAWRIEWLNEDRWKYDVVVVISHQQVCKGEVTGADTQDDAGENGMMVLESICIHRAVHTILSLHTYVYTCMY